MKLDHSLWIHKFEKIYAPNLRLIIETLEKRLLPTFGKIKEEANVVYNEAYRRYGLASPYDDDYETHEKSAYDASTSFTIDQYSVRQGTLNLFTVFLYHCFENQILTFIFQEMACRNYEYRFKEFKIEDVSKLEIDIFKFKSWPQIKEIRLAANVVKHAVGRSEEKLRRLRPDLFVHPQVQYPEMLDFSKDSRVDISPLSGDDFFVSLDQLKIWCDGIIEFWRELLCSIERRE